MSASTTFLLPRELTIYQVAEVHAELLSVINDSDSLKISGHDIEDLDTAGLQLLLWSRSECQKMDKQWYLVSSSDALSSKFEQIGISLESLF